MCEVWGKSSPEVRREKNLSAKKRVGFKKRKRNLLRFALLGDGGEVEEKARGCARRAVAEVRAKRKMKQLRRRRRVRVRGPRDHMGKRLPRRVSRLDRFSKKGLCSRGLFWRTIGSRKGVPVKVDSLG